MSRTCSHILGLLKLFMVDERGGDGMFVYDIKDIVLG